MRPPLRLAQRPELAAAFERGELARAARSTAAEALSDETLAEMASLRAEEREAYRLGLAGEVGVRAPAPLKVEVPARVVALAADAFARVPGPKLQWASRVAVSLVAFALSHRAIETAERRRTRELALTPATAPRPGPAHVLVGPLLLELAHQLWLRRRFGCWSRADSSTAAAATIVRAVRRRRDWKLAYDHPSNMR